MSVLDIDAARDLIRPAILRARSHPLTLEQVQALMMPEDKPVVTLDDKPPDPWRPPSEEVFLPMHYRLCISFEEQPCGMCLHISVSVRHDNKLPHPAAVDTIGELCLDEVSAPNALKVKGWLEEFRIDGKPGGHAVNIVYLLAPVEAGHA